MSCSARAGGQASVGRQKAGDKPSHRAPATAVEGKLSFVGRAGRGSWAFLHSQHLPAWPGKGCPLRSLSGLKGNGATVLKWLRELFTQMSPELPVDAESHMFSYSSAKEHISPCFQDLIFFSSCPVSQQL